jgi:hypothetical protein
VVSAAGWQIQRVDVAAGGEPAWVVIAEAHAVTTPTAVRDARWFFEGVAATNEGDYDGWEVSVWLRAWPGQRTHMPLSARLRKPG